MIGTDWREDAYSLVNEYGLTYREAGDVIEKRYGVRVSDDTIRYHAKRKIQAQRLTRASLSESHRTTRLVLADLHIPFMREDIVKDIVMRHRAEIDAITIAGDGMDFGKISAYRDGLVEPDEEVIAFYRFIKWLQRVCPGIPIDVIEGNHDFERWKRHLSIQPNALNPFHSDNPYEMMADGFIHYDRRSKVKRVFASLGETFHVVDNWFVRYGDAIIAHPTSYSGVPLRTAINTAAYMRTHGIEHAHVYIGHTHKLGYVVVDDDVTCGEIGCLCEEFDYAKGGKLNYTPQKYGYLLLVQRNGVTDPNATRIVRIQVKDGENEWREVEENSDLS